jgi:hypothetical protein
MDTDVVRAEAAKSSENRVICNECSELLLLLLQRQGKHDKIH